MARETPIPPNDLEWKCKVRGCLRRIWARIAPDCPDHGIRMVQA